MALKAFISHTSADKDSWARPLATKLLELGVDAWLDEWEIQPGDSIVQKVFSSGIAGADAFVVVLSKESVTKPWVNAELDVAVINNIEKLTRLIPVLVDNCAVPEALKAKLHLSIKRLGSTDAIAKEIADTLHGVSKKPPLGPSPAYVKKARIKLPSLSEFDCLTLETLYDQNVDNQGIFARTPTVSVDLAKDGVTETQVLDSLEILVSQNWLNGRHKHRGRHDMVDFYPHTILAVAGAKGEDVDGIRCRIVAELLNTPNNQFDVDAFVTSTGIKKLIVWAFCTEFHSKGLATRAYGMGPSMGVLVLKNGAILRRWSSDNCP